MTEEQIRAASYEWYGNALIASLMLARARLGAGEKPESWGSAAREIRELSSAWDWYMRRVKERRGGGRR